MGTMGWSIIQSRTGTGSYLVSHLVRRRRRRRAKKMLVGRLVVVVAFCHRDRKWETRATADETTHKNTIVELIIKKM